MASRRPLSGASHIIRLHLVGRWRRGRGGQAGWGLSLSAASCHGLSGSPGARVNEQRLVGPPWCSAARGAPSASLFCFCRPAAAVALEAIARRSSNEGAVRGSERYGDRLMTRLVVRLTNDISSCSWPPPVGLHPAVPTTALRSPLFASIRPDRCATSRFGRIGTSATALQRATAASLAMMLQSAHANLHGSALLVATPRRLQQLVTLPGATRSCNLNWL